MSDETDHIAKLENDVRKLQAFKDYVHRRLDVAGVPTHPGGPHSSEGCRIGDRLDLVLRNYAPTPVPQWPGKPDDQYCSGDFQGALER